MLSVNLRVVGGGDVGGVVGDGGIVGDGVVDTSSGATYDYVMIVVL